MDEIYSGLTFDEIVKTRTGEMGKLRKGDDVAYLIFTTETQRHGVVLNQFA